MQLSGTAVLGYQVYEYLLVLSPPEDLWNKIMKLKEDVAQKYQTDLVRWTKPHITLVNFLQYEMLQERIVYRLKTIAMSFSPFKIELKDFGSFPSHTIYVNVISKLPIQNVVKEIRADAQRLMKLNADNKPHFIMEPHFTIARKLKPWQYEKGWLEYSHLHFSGRFIAQEMILLKRPVGTMKYHIVAKFDFQNMPVATRQGQLF